MRALGVAPSLLRRTPRQIYALALDDLDAFPERLAIDSPYFVLLLVADFASASRDRGGLSERILDAGCVYFCAWGNGCEQMHDFVDETIVMRELHSRPIGTIMTTWHSSESLEEAVEFALGAAEPDDQFAASCRTVVLATVGRQDWAAEVAEVALQYVI